MFASIRTKVFLLLVIANSLLVGLLLAFNAATFNRGFIQYVTEQESRRLEPLVNNIAAEYEARQNWEWVAWKNPVWMTVVRSSFGQRDIRSLERDAKGPIPDLKRGFFGRLIIRETQTNQILLGRKPIPKNVVWIPIATHTGDVVAELGFEPEERLDAKFDNVFAAKQRKDILFIGVVGVLLAACLAIPFSGWLVKPIQLITHAVRRMTNGDLSVAVTLPGKDELAQLASDFNLLAKALRKNHTDREQWVSDIAHELRTPVTIFQADIEAAQDGVRQVDSQWLANMHSQVERLTGLVNDLHQLSQSDAGTLSYRFEQVDLIDVIDCILNQFSPSFELNFVDVNFHASTRPVWVRGDDDRLKQLFANLGQNTLRYTDGDVNSPGRLSVNVFDHDENITVTWSDSAPGVGDIDLAKLFDRLYRVDESRSRESGGSGLGLAIAKNIVEAHGGQISAEHSELGGLTITVIMPKH